MAGLAAPAVAAGALKRSVPWPASRTTIIEPAPTTTMPGAALTAPRTEPRAWIRVAGGDIERTLCLVDGRRAPDAAARAPVGHHVGGVLHPAGRGVELNQPALDQRAVGERGYADVDAASIEGRRAPDEMVW